MDAKCSTKFRCDDTGKLLLRLSIGGLMLFHGVAKLQHGIDGITGALAAKGWPTAIAYGVYVGEFIAPILILIGFLTRPAALIVAFNMVMAVYLAHLGDIFKITPHGGPAIEINLLYFLGALALFFLGGGKFGVSRGRGTWN